MDKVEIFREIADSLGNLYEKKNKAYGDSFGSTFEKLGIISAVTRISDKHNRLVNLAVNPDIDNLGGKHRGHTQRHGILLYNDIN